jgi:hypothetical protein
MFLKHILEVIIILPREYILIFLDNINSLDSFSLLCFLLLEMLPDGLPLFQEFLLVLLLPLLLLLPLGFQLIDLFGSELNFFTHPLIMNIKSNGTAYRQKLIHFI